MPGCPAVGKERFRIGRPSPNRLPHLVASALNRLKYAATTTTSAAAQIAL
jgi:hypothetical protein